MAGLKKYSSFKDLKLETSMRKTIASKEQILSEFEYFIKQLQREYSNKKKIAKRYGR